MRLHVAPMNRADPTVGRDFATGFVRQRNTDDYNAWKNHAAMLVRTLWAPRAKLSPGPVLLEVVFVVAAPKKQAASLAGLWCAKRPDLDRYVHAIQDAITDAGNVWDDDNQVARCISGKRYCFVGEPASIIVECSSLPLMSPTHELELQQGGRQRSDDDGRGAASSSSSHFPPMKGAFR